MLPPGPCGRGYETVRLDMAPSPVSGTSLLANYYEWSTREHSPAVVTYRGRQRIFYERSVDCRLGRQNEPDMVVAISMQSLGANMATS